MSERGAREDEPRAHAPANPSLDAARSEPADWLTPRRAGRIAWVAVGAVVVFLIVAGWALTHPAPDPIVLGWGAGPWTFGAAGALCLLLAVVGAVIVGNRPRNAIGWLNLGAGLNGAICLATIVAMVNSDAQPGEPLHVAGFVAASVAQGSLVLAFLVPLWFPDGPRSAGRFAWLAPLIVATFVIRTFEILFQPSANYLFPGLEPNPYQGTGVVGELWRLDGIAIGWWLSGFCAIAVGVAVVQRSLASRGIQRLQLRWFGASVAAMVPIVIVLADALVRQPPIGGRGDELIGLLYLAVSLPVLATLIAITRYRLYEIDRLINRTLVYGLITTVLAGAFAAANEIAKTAFVVLTGDTSEASLAFATLLVTILYAPVRAWVETAVSRHVRYADNRLGPYRDELLHALEWIETPAAAQRLLAEVGQHIGATTAAVVLDDGGGSGVRVATLGDWRPERLVARVPIVVEDARVGEVQLGARRHGQPYADREFAAVAEVASLFGRTIRARRSWLVGDASVRAPESVGELEPASALPG
jgi:hypothetical protein